MDDTRWLSPEEQDTWLRLMAVTMHLPSELEKQLKRDSDLTHFEYYVLAMLSESPDRALLMSDLAAITNSSPSRLSHVVARVEKQGWVHREPSPTDGRATIARLTDAGWEKVTASAPGHVAAVRQLVFDPLSRDDIDELGRSLGKILQILDPSHRLLHYRDGTATPGSDSEDSADN